MKKFPLFEYYTLRFPNDSPDKVSVYVVGWVCIALFGLCIALWDIPAAILTVVFLGIILTGVMLRVNFRTFQLKNPCSVPFLLPMDIACEAAKETDKYTSASFLAEFNQIASPRHDLKRVKKQGN